MPKGSYYSSTLIKPAKKKEPNPVWRAIGLIFIIVVPLLSIIASLVLVDQNQKHEWFTFPNDLMLPKATDPLIAIKILYAVIFLLVFSALATLITFLVYKFFGPPRYGPYDVPSESFHKIKK
jgi:hypothetical protein